MPFPVPAVFSAVSVALNLAWVIYDKGFRSNVPYSQDFEQLVNAVSEFAIALQSINDTFIRANNEVARNHVGQYIHHEQSLHSFKTIIGDFEVTLEDCRRLLDRKESFGRNQGGLRARIEWNVSAKEETKELRDRLIFHNTRLNLALQPLKLSLALSVKEFIAQAIQDGFQEIRQDLAAIKEHLGIREHRAPVDIDSLVLPAIPPYLLARFDMEAEFVNELPISDEVRISSVMGHLPRSPVAEDITANMPRDELVRKYVNLMKAAWILDKPSPQLAASLASSSSMNVTTWRELKVKVIIEVSAFHSTQGYTSTPSTEEIRNLPKECFILWLFQPVATRPTDIKVADFSETVLFEAPIETGPATHRQQLVVLGSLDGRETVRIVTRVVNSSGGSTNWPAVNTKTTILQPTYAQPKAELFNVQLRTSARDRHEELFQFRNPSDLFRFQRCLTGFEVKHDQVGITGVKYKHSGIQWVKSIKVLSDNHDVVRAQIWFHSPVYADKSLPSGRETPSSPRTGTSNGPSSSRSTRRRSHVSSTPSQAHSIDQWAERNAPSSLAPANLASHTIVQEIPDLEEPKVVIFLAIIDVSNTNPDLQQIKKLAYFTFSLRDGVYIDPSSCECRRDSECNVMVVKSRGILNARLYEYTHDLANWNLAALGQAGHVDADQNCRDLEDLNRIVVAFRDARDRELFGDMLNKATALYEQRRNRRERDIHNVQQGDVVRVR